MSCISQAGEKQDIQKFPEISTVQWEIVYKDENESWLIINYCCLNVNYYASENCR